MAVFNAGQMSAPNIIATAQRHLIRVNDALTDVSGFYKWLSGQSDGDLEAGPVSFAPADLSVIRTGIYDAHALAQLYDAGTLPAGYTLPYVLGASQIIAIGPR